MVLGYAAARVTSVCDAFDLDTALGHLARQLDDPDALDRRVRVALAATLPRAVRRGPARSPSTPP